MLDRLITKYGYNQPIFTSEILLEMKDYSRARVFQLIKEAELKEHLIKFEKGVYYIPTQTRYGKSVITVEDVINKKYITDGINVYGIYCGLALQQNFMLATQIPTTIEVISNNETMWIREIKYKNRNVILRKSRLLINNENVYAYTILELFTVLDINKLNEDNSIRNAIVSYIKEHSISLKDILNLIVAFPSKTMRNLIESGIINEIT